MKQNKTYKILTGLVLVTILTTTVIGSTMANFTVASNFEDSARIGVCNIAVTAVDLFNKKYISDDATLAAAGTYTIKSDAKVIGPGSSNSIDLKLNGETEYMVDACYSLDVELNGDWKDANGGFYCPLIFKIKKYTSDSKYDEYKINGLDYQSKEALLAAIKSNVVCHENLTANNRYIDYIPATVEWSWPFTTSEANNLKDTFLVNQTYPNPISLKLICKTQFTQID